MAEAAFLALGDSYTIGEGVAPGGRWPDQLATLLRAEGIGVSAPRVVATTGWTTEELEGGIAATGITGRFDLVTLLIGVNDQYRGRSLAQYRDGFARLLRAAIAFAGGEVGRVVVLSIPDWGVTPFAAGRDREAIAEEIDLFNAENRSQAAEAGTGYVDVTAQTRAAGGDPAMLVADGLHPSASTYGEWARLTLPVARAALGR